MRYDPFGKRFESITGDDLAALRSAPEGWHVEYKSELIQTKALAKSISAFANHYGGWLFIGVVEVERKASSFPGIPLTDVGRAEEALRNAAKDCVTPHVFFEHRVIVGPVDSIGLPADRAIIVVMVPLGRDAPYVHVDGRIYRRIADASDPRSEADRGVLDALWQRGRRSRKTLRKFITKRPTVSKAERDSPYIQLFISHDPLSQSGRAHYIDFSRIARMMKEGDLPFTNVFSHSGGITARQTTNNDPYRRLFTWEYSFLGHSTVSIPLSCANGRLEEYFGSYDQFTPFHEVLERENMSVLPRILDLNILFNILGLVVQKHRKLLKETGEIGPFFAKARLDSVWRTIPFLDTHAFVDFVRENGLPVIQHETALAPPGTSPESLLMLQRMEIESTTDWITDASPLAASIFFALGLPGDVLLGSANELAYLLGRAQEAQRRRGSMST